MSRSACLLLPLLGTSCFTMGLWGFFPDAETDPASGRSETVFAYDQATTWSWEEVGLRILLTPLAFGLDCLTCPVQCFLHGDDDDDCRAGT